MNAPESRRHFDLLDLDEDHAKGLAFNMLFMIWRRRTLATAYTRGMQIVRELGTKYPEGVGVLQVVAVDAIPPDSAARSALDFTSDERPKHLLGDATSLLEVE